MWQCDSLIAVTVGKIIRYAYSLSMKKILFISGSFRRGSFNRQLLEYASAMLSDSFECSFLDYSDIPFLNQDEEYPAPESVKRVRDVVAAADALWIGSPEYNHSYSAVLKNLIDWMSRPVISGDYSTAVIRGKLAVLSSVAGSSGGSFSLKKLRELLEMLSCTVLEEETRIPLGARFGKELLELDDDEMFSLKRECGALREKL